MAAHGISSGHRHHAFWRVHDGLEQFLHGLHNNHRRDDFFHLRLLQTIGGKEANLSRDEGILQVSMTIHRPAELIGVGQ